MEGTSSSEKNSSSSSSLFKTGNGGRSDQTELSSGSTIPYVHTHTTFSYMKEVSPTLFKRGGEGGVERMEKGGMEGGGEANKISLRPR